MIVYHHFEKLLKFKWPWENKTKDIDKKKNIDQNQDFPLMYSLAESEVQISKQSFNCKCLKSSFC